jgi:hypothetical protein
MQKRVEVREANQPLDDGLGTGDEKLAPLFGQAPLCPHKYRKAAAVHEAKCGEIHHEELGRMSQGTADGRTQLVLGGRVEFAL